MKQSLFRKLTHESLTGLILNGEILDVGGDSRSLYTKLLAGEHRLTILNLNPEAKPDIICDIEQVPWPVVDKQYDVVLLINVMEHIYNYSGLIEESYRILKPGGKIVLIVPFLYYIHPSPHDYFRFTKETLECLLTDHKFNQIIITTLGYGAFSAAYNLIHRFFPQPVHWVFCRLAIWLDKFNNRLAVWGGKKYQPEDYPLGYMILASKTAK